MNLLLVLLGTGIGVLVLAVDVWLAPVWLRWREGRVSSVEAELRPQPGIRASRRFRRETRLSLVGDELRLASAKGRELWLGGPRLPLGVVEFVPVRDPRQRDPWGMALAGGRGMLLAVLPYQDWFGTDMGQAELERFAHRMGMRVGTVPVEVERNSHGMSWDARIKLTLIDGSPGVSSLDYVPIAGVAFLHGLVGLWSVPLAVVGFTGMAVSLGGGLIRQIFRKAYYDRPILRGVTLPDAGSEKEPGQHRA